MARPYRMRKQLKTGEVREYIGYRIILPHRLVEELGLKGEAGRGGVVPPPRLDRAQEQDAVAEAAREGQARPVQQEASPRRLITARLGPREADTLEDIEEAIKRKVLAEIQAQSPT
ncbi:MAG: hypothetical protein F7C08_04085 [Desulfurococcales archaeon]|nr:hypothetical protein [Desulfurococcales archaeon]MCE4605693.1 hypothetical protein [Desulfurococcales archaeon]